MTVVGNFLSAPKPVQYTTFAWSAAALAVAAWIVFVVGLTPLTAERLALVGGITVAMNVGMLASLFIVGRRCAE